MKKCVQTVSKLRDHEDYDAFFLCVMSHGTCGAVYGVDGVEVGIETDIVQPFYQDRCEALCGKPKVFLFQACQGGISVVCFGFCSSYTILHLAGILAWSTVSPKELTPCTPHTVVSTISRAVVLHVYRKAHGRSGFEQKRTLHRR